MKRLPPYPLALILLSLLVPASHAAPPPYWPPYYYPPSPMTPPPAPLSAKEEVEEPAAQQKSPSKHEARNDSAGSDNELSQPAPAEDTVSESNTSTGSPGDEESSPQGEREEPANTATSAQPGAQGDESDEWQLAREISTAIQQGNFAEAYYLWRPRAEAGDADAQYGIGWMYHNGYGLAIDDEEASAWWKLASRQGHTDATFALGMLYGLGEGEIKRDMKRAVDYYHQAALDDHEDARLLLRTLMAEGDKAALELMYTLLDEGRVAEIISPAAVISNKANVRRGPGTSHKVLITLQEQHTLMPLRRKGRWLHVGIKGERYTGWIHDSLVGREILVAPAN